MDMWREGSGNVGDGRMGGRDGSVMETVVEWMGGMGRGFGRLDEFFVVVEMSEDDGGRR